MNCDFDSTLNCICISIASKGNSMNMLKSGIKRRRTTRQITDEKAEEAVRARAIEEKIASFDELQRKYNQAKQEAENGKGATIILSNMINEGKAEMDQHGNFNLKPQIINQSEMSQSSQQQHQQEMMEESNGFQI